MKTTTSSPRTTLLLGSSGFFLITLDILIVNLALPQMGAGLNASTDELQWVVDSYTLLFAALLLCAGNLSDRIGAKSAFTYGVVLFGAASVLCTLAPSTGVLIAARGTQGVAAALMLPPSMALIREAFPDAAARARALGVWAAGGAVSSAVGPLLGGVLTTWDWRLVFAINIPICVAMLILLPRVASSPRRGVPFDWPGQTLGLIGLGALLFSVIEAGTAGLAHPVVLLGFAVAVVCLGGFVAVQARGNHPMMPLALFRPRGMRIAIIASFTFIFCWFGTVFLLTLYLQQHLGLSPFSAGLVFLPSAVLALIGNLSSGPLTNRWGTKRPVVAGLTAMTLGLAAAALLAPTDSVWLVVVVLVLVGAGGSVAMPPLAGLVLDSAAAEQAGVASAIQNTFRQIGGALAIALFGAFVSGTAGFVSGVQIGFTVAALLGVVAVATSISIPRREHPASPSTPTERART